MPFDWKTPYGFFPAYLAQCVGVAANLMPFVQFFNFIFGSCWLFIFIAEDITKDLSAFNIITTTTFDDGIGLADRFCDIIKVYLDAKQ